MSIASSVRTVTICDRALSEGSEERSVCVLQGLGLTALAFSWGASPWRVPADTWGGRDSGIRAGAAAVLSGDSSVGDKLCTDCLCPS